MKRYRQDALQPALSAKIQKCLHLTRNVLMKLPDLAVPLLYKGNLVRLKL